MVNTANTIVAVFGFLILAASLWGFASPERLLRTVDGVMASSLGMPVAISSRVILGTALIVAAPGSWTPRVFGVVGVMSLLAAAALPFIGHSNVRRLVKWLQRWPVIMIRGWLVFGALFGAYLIYAVS